MERKLAILIFGSTPPPVGGVTKSVEYLCNALRRVGHRPTLFSLSCLFRRFDVAHIHYSRSWKRFVGAVLGRFLAKKVIFTLHGNHYRNDIFNNWTASIVDGVVFLNPGVKVEHESKFKNSCLMTSLVKEGISPLKNDVIPKANIGLNQEPSLDTTISCDDSGPQYVPVSSSGKIRLLIYAYDKVLIDGEDVYGIDFMLAHMSDLPSQYELVFLDPKGAYRDDVLQINSSRVIYIERKVNFLKLLSEVDVYLRPSSTDGSSLAIQEALIMGVPVVASDSIDRGVGVIVYRHKDFSALLGALDNVEGCTVDCPADSITTYLEFVRSI